jgi:AAA domain
LFNDRIEELEQEFTLCLADKAGLRRLLHELSHRSSPRAQALRTLVEKALEAAEPSQRRPSASPLVPPSPSKRPPALVEESPRSFLPSSEQTALPAQPFVHADSRIPVVQNAPSSILDAWTALEVLSPQTFKQPEKLAGGDRRAVASWKGGRLPWEGIGERARPRTLFYQVVLGTVDFGAAIERLLFLYADSRAERPAASGETILASVTINQTGHLVEAPAATVSSFAWGMPRALRGDLASLAAWRAEEVGIAEALEEILRGARNRGDDEAEPALDRKTIMRAYEWLLERLGLPRDLTTPPRFAIRVYPPCGSSPEPLLVNSFFLGDLASARAMLSEGRVAANLRLYVGERKPPRTRDLLRDREALDAAVAPGVTPPARWPGKGRHPLVLLQQAAVNLAFQELREGGILGINGPPGTGKTTLLRDLVAAVVTERAEVMAGFDDPSSALIDSGQTIKVGKGGLHLYRLDPRLRGFEMIVASSNNKAVENVSAALPGLDAIADDAPDLRYFRTLSDTLFERGTWGLIAAVLGNAKNRSRFKKTFWQDKDVGLSTYLAEVAGTPQVFEEVDPETGARSTRQPRIVTAENPPRSQGEALRRWRHARSVFLTALAKSRVMLAIAEKMRRFACWSGAQARLAEHDRHAPGLLARLFWTRAAREWRSARAPLAKTERQARAEASRAEQQLTREEKALAKATAQGLAAERLRAEAARRHGEVLCEVQAWRERLGDRFIGDAFWEKEHTEKQKTPPWLDAEQQRLRDDVFTAAMALHRAFLDAAAKPLRHNLGVLMSLFGGRSLPTTEKRALIPDLWSSLFIAVPLISTTFASVERMLRDLPLESLGWLFVDEAGQAVPQAAVGAIFRSRRAVVVGDPMQIEPVVTLPDRLTQAVCRHFGADPDRFNAPDASVQTLADAASPLLTEIETPRGSRKIGAPLLVHRRCSEPMFGISNAIAYEYLMVNAKRAEPSTIGELLGPSRWIDVRGNAEEKWCPEEGLQMLEMLRKLAAPGRNHWKPDGPDLYIVTPFRQVADRLRKLVEESELLVWADHPSRWTLERIGNIHIVQGREAEAVIFILGAPAPGQTGARAWAGSKPNLLNVAVTRAKERLYVVGNRELWRKAGVFSELDARLPPSNVAEYDLDDDPGYDDDLRGA